MIAFIVEHWVAISASAAAIGSHFDRFYRALLAVKGVRGFLRSLWTGNAEQQQTTTQNETKLN